MNAPIALFVYNRPAHLRLTLEALRNAYGATDTPLYIFSDGSRTGSEVCVDAVRSLCNEVNGFASVEVIRRESNIGLAANIIQGVTQLFNMYDNVVVLEDDLVVSPYFIRYMNSALTFYQSRNVFSIAAYTPNMQLPSDYKSTTFALQRNCSWGWATWKNKWQSVDWNVTRFDEFIDDATQCKAFNNCGNDLVPMLLKQHLGIINSWSIRFCFAAFMAGEPTIYPTESFVRNQGVDGSGTNMRVSRRYDTRLAQSLDTSRFAVDIEPDSRIVASFRKFYDTSLYRRIINHLKIQQYRKYLKQ